MTSRQRRAAQRPRDVHQRPELDDPVAGQARIGRQPGPIARHKVVNHRRPKRFGQVDHAVLDSQPPAQLSRHGLIAAPPAPRASPPAAASPSARPAPAPRPAGVWRPPPSPHLRLAQLPSCSGSRLRPSPRPYHPGSRKGKRGKPKLGFPRLVSHCFLDSEPDLHRPRRARSHAQLARDALVAVEDHVLALAVIDAQRSGRAHHDAVAALRAEVIVADHIRR